jgi:hypothetical protein
MKKKPVFYKEFKKWLKTNKTVFKDDLYTQLINVNKEDIQLDKWTVETILFTKQNGIDFDYSQFDINLEGKETTIEILKEVFNAFGLNKEFKHYWKFLEALIEYREEGVKDSSKEWNILNKYWKWTKNLFDKNFENFNNWILITNKIVYTKQKGYNL